MPANRKSLRMMPWLFRFDVKRTAKISPQRTSRNWPRKVVNFAVLCQHLSKEVFQP